MLAGDTAPTIDPITDLSIPEDASRQIISLSGIGAGAGQPESLRVSVFSQNEALVDHPVVIYQPGQATGLIEFQPTPDEHGMATIVVTVEDAGPDNDDETDSDNGLTTLTFTVEVSSVNDEPTLTSPATGTKHPGQTNKTCSACSNKCRRASKLPAKVFGSMARVSVRTCWI